MAFFKRKKNLIQKETVGLTAQGLLDFLGISDNTKPKAMAETTYFTCLKVLSEALGKMPLKYYQEQADGGRVRAPTTNEAYALINRPNPYMSAATFWATLETNCEHYGNAYAYIQPIFIRNGAYGGDYKYYFWPMQSQAVTVYMDDEGIFGDKGALFYKYCNSDNGRTYVFRNSQVMHFKTWLTWDGIMGKSVRDILRTTIDGEWYSQKYLEKLYQSGMTASAVLQYTGDLDKQQREKLQQIYGDLLSGAKNAGKVVAMPIGMSLQPLTYKLADSQFLELKKYSALQIAAAFGVKPNQINDYDKSSYASSEAQQIAFLTDTLLYRIAMYEQEINYKCLTEDERKQGYFYKFNERVLLRTTFDQQMSGLAQGIQNGMYSTNEARDYLNMPHKDGGDKLIVNGNYIPLEDVGKQYSNGTEEA